MLPAGIEGFCGQKQALAHCNMRQEPSCRVCHARVYNDYCVAGYDVSTEKSYNDTIRNFDKTVGLKYLKGMHINDSKCVPHLLWGHEMPMYLLLVRHVAETMQHAVNILVLRQS